MPWPRIQAKCLTLVAAIAPAACVGVPAASSGPAGAPEQPGPAALAPTTALAPTATLALDLSALWGGPARGLLALRTLPRKATITIAGPDAQVAFTATQDLAGDGTLVTLGGVPAGPKMLVKLAGLDAEGKPLPGLPTAVVGAIGPGPSTLAISAASTAAARVVEAVASRDAAQAAELLGRLDYDGLNQAVPRYMRELRVPHAGLLDVAAIATAIVAANGAVPVAAPAFALRPGQLVLQPAGWPPGATGTLYVDDPASQPTPFAGEPTVVTGVAPGTWTVTLMPDQAGLAPIATTAVVGAGATVRLPIAVTPTSTREPLTQPRGGAAAGVVTLQDGSEALAIAGGSTLRADAPPPRTPALADTLLRLPAVAQVPPLALPAPVAGPAAAAHGGRLFWFGGVDALGPVGTAWTYDPAGAGRIVARAALPGGRAIVGAAAGTVRTKIYLTGGQRADGQASSDTLAYDPVADAWTDGLPALVPHRSAMASAVVGDTWYLFGGFGDDRLAAPQAAGPARPVTDATAWTPGVDGSFRAIARMPTPRAGAAAVAVGTKIWVIGGLTRDQALTGAIEVYDAGSDTWSVRAPLQQARAFPAVGLLAGRIVVAGGLIGVEPSTDLPVATVEDFVP